MAATATLATKAVTVTPGGEAVSEVRIRNSGTIVDQFTLEVLGDPAAWSIVEPAVVPLFPGAEAVARLKFKPPKASTVLARAYPFAVRVRSREDAKASLVEEGTVQVGPFYDTFAEIIPRTARGSSRARAQLALDNKGNAPINARLTAADPDRKLNFAISPQALTAEPGTASFAALRLTPRQRFLVGPPKINPYKVMVHQDGLPTITVDGSMQQLGLVPPWLIPLVVAGLAIFLILAILWFTLLRPNLLTETQKLTAQNAQVAQSAAAKASAAASAAIAVHPTPTPGTQIVGPNGGPAYSNVLVAADPNKSSITITDGGNLIVTDVVFENPDGNAGTLYWQRGNSPLLTMHLENFRDYDLHFVTPQVFNAKDQMQLVCKAAGGSSCNDVFVYYSGYYKNPPSS